MARPGLVRHAQARQAWRATAGPGLVRLGTDGQGRRAIARQCVERKGVATQARSAKAASGMVGQVISGKAGASSPGKSWTGPAGLGTARYSSRGLAWKIEASSVEDRHDMAVEARIVPVRLGPDWVKGKAMQAIEQLDDPPTTPGTNTRLRFCHIDCPSDETVRYGKLSLANFNGSIGWSWCAPQDQFSRKRGRMIATGRLGCVRSTSRPVHIEDDRAWMWRAALALLSTYAHRTPTWLDVELFSDHCQFMIDRISSYGASHAR